MYRKHTQLWGRAGVRRWILAVLGLIIQWGFPTPSYAVSETNNFGPPYAFYSQIPDATQYASLDQITKVGSAYLAGWGGTAGC
jgi:hypothetical protein